MKRLTKEEFIKLAKEIHGEKYDYSLVNYNGTHVKIKIICPEHGEFEQTPNSHKRGNGCSKCKNVYNYSTDEFIEKANFKHNNKYDYSLVNYKTNKNKITIICPKHGEFKQKGDHHLRGVGCPECKNVKNKNTDKFIKDAKEIHSEKYNYSYVNYINNKTEVKIICPKHGEFKQTPNHHLRGEGCPTCSESKGENKIRIFLEKNNLKYLKQKRFKECKNKYSLPFDFYLPEQNICIEYDGIQHFKPIKAFGGQKSFDKLKINDNIKDSFCKKENIKLVRISYIDFNKIDMILKNEIDI
jgi:hypothetical protein